jgi:hypothetical protein
MKMQGRLKLELREVAAVNKGNKAVDSIHP